MPANCIFLGPKPFRLFLGYVTVPVPEMPAPGGQRAGRKTQIPAVQSGFLGLRSRCCAGGSGLQAAPSRAPEGQASGLCLVDSDAVLPPTAAAFFAPFCGKAVMRTDKINLLNRFCGEVRVEGLYSTAGLIRQTEASPSGVVTVPTERDT